MVDDRPLDPSVVLRHDFNAGSVLLPEPGGWLLLPGAEPAKEDGLAIRCAASVPKGNTMTTEV
jgi:hypothetical protein